MVPKRPTVRLIPNQAALKAATKRLPNFEPHDLRALVDEAGTGGDRAILMAFRRRTKKQLFELLTRIGIDPSQPDAWERGFFWLAYFHCGVGHLSWNERRTNRNAATWTLESELTLLKEVTKFMAEGLSEHEAIKRIVSDPQLKKRLPYQEHFRGGSSNFSKQNETRKRQAALWRHLQHLKKRSSRPYAILDQLAGPGWNAQSDVERLLYALDFIIPSNLTGLSPADVMKNNDPAK